MRFRKNKLMIFLILILLILGTFFYQINKSLPEGISFESEKIKINADKVEFLYDLSYLNDEGNRISDQQIFPEIFSLIDSAEEYILIDMFLFNSYMAKATDKPYMKLSDKLTDRLISKKQEFSDIKIDFITDPINIVYRGAENKQINKLRDAGVNVIITDLKPLRDSNPSYSSFWRIFMQWFGNSTGGLFPHPFSEKEEKVSLRSYLSLLNFKANHRKVFVADNNEEFSTIIMSANLHDGSSAHSNVALKINGNFWKDVYSAEMAVAKMSDNNLQNVKINNINNISLDKTAQVKLLTEEKIKQDLLSNINKTKKEDEIFLAMFYLSDYDIVDALIKSSNRGVRVRLILDPNKDAFGYEKNGIPNRPVANKLLTKTNNKIKIRWYNTHGEQFHAKLSYIKKDNNHSYALLGSANLTRRNLDNYNLEMNASVVATSSTKVIKDIEEYLEMLWESKVYNYTIDYNKYEDDSFLKKLMYFIQEKTGLSSF